MSSTAAVTANGRDFWAFDVSISFLAYEILAVGRTRSPGPWFEELVPSLTGVAVVAGTVGLNLDPVVEADAVEAFAAIVTEAGARLRALGAVTGTDAEARRTEGHPAIWRAGPGSALPTAPIADLADAVVALLRGTLPPSPPGTWWAYGWPDGPRTIPMSTEPPRRKELRRGGR